jgi:hypothetical protein
MMRVSMTALRTLDSEVFDTKTNDGNGIFNQTEYVCSYRFNMANVSHKICSGWIAVVT